MFHVSEVVGSVFFCVCLEMNTVKGLRLGGVMGGSPCERWAG